MFKQLRKFFYKEYKLTVNHMGRVRVIHVKQFHTKRPKNLSGIDINNQKFEITSVEPMEWYIEEWYGE